MQDLLPIYRQPEIESTHPGAITALFQYKTCGILSVKDDCEENPWRSLIWPLTRNNPALNHAIAAMTCLHLCNTRPELHNQGLSHVRQSIRRLREGIRSRTIRLDAALATTIALSLAKSWETPRTSTGVEYLQETKSLLRKAITSIDTSQLSQTRARRLSFLANTWIYMDVIVRLTSSDLNDSIDTELMKACSILKDNSEQSKIDPLMGCAAELFPLIGKAADLVRCVWQDCSRRHAPLIVGQAAEVMCAVEKWIPQLDFTNETGPACIVSDALQTAEAYRWATVLLLRQAIPALPGFLSHEELARKILVCLATVPISSGMIIVHTFPLLVAGCELAGREDRQWVCERWKLMSDRMITGIVDRCLEVTTESWRRKDEESGSQSIHSNSSVTISDPSEQTSSKNMVTVDDFFNEFVELSEEHGGWDAEASLLNGRSSSSEIDDHVVPVASPTNKLGPAWPTNAIRRRLNWLAVMHDWKWQSKASTAADALLISKLIYIVKSC
jgi:hypothetical protein